MEECSTTQKTGRSMLHRHLHPWKQFRHEISGCGERATDALFKTGDALLSEDRARSFPDVSLSPHVQRRWPCVDEACEDGRSDASRWRQVCACHLPPGRAGHDRWIGMDVRDSARPRARTSADRSAVPVQNLPACETPITGGWQCSTVVALPDTPSRWTSALDQQRVRTQTTAAQVAFAPVPQVVPVVPPNTITVLGRGDDATGLWGQCSTLPFKGPRIRLKGHRWVSRPVPAQTGKPGAPRTDGPTRHPKEEAPHGAPSGHGAGQDAKGRPIQVCWWNQMHGKTARWVTLTVVQVGRPQAAHTERDPRRRWCVWSGDPQADVSHIALGSVRRFRQDQGSRFDTHALWWAEPRLRTPEHVERWSQIVASAHTHLVLARALVEAERRPWDSTRRTLTPQQVRRGMHTVVPQVGTPARPPHPCGTSPGRAKGATVNTARRCAVVQKRPPVPHLVPP
jgi:hypothetical protein